MALALQPLGGADEDVRSPFVLPEKDGAVSVGRRVGCDLILEDVSVSALHAWLERNGNDEVALVDCGSSNGTFVNGMRVKRRDIEVGDLVRFASVEFRVVETTDRTAMEGGNGTDLQTERIAGKPSRGGLESELPDSRDETLEKLRAELAEVSVESARLRSELDRSRKELETSADRVERSRKELALEREKNLELESRVAALEFELRRSESEQQSTEEKRQKAIDETEEWRTAFSEQEERLGESLREITQARESEASALGRLAEIENEASILSERLLGDWSVWFDRPPEETESSDSPFVKVHRVADRVREQLDRIEPIWNEFGDGVREELERRCETVRGELKKLGEEKAAAIAENSRISEELENVRLAVDSEVRRARSLSRSGTMVEIPERFETMVVATDREQEIFRRLIERLELLDHLLAGYRGNRRMKEAIPELEDFRTRIASILSENGVEEFEIPIGSELTLKHRKEVQILGRKGWGTRDYVEQTFRPGEVVKTVRTGYRAGSGEGATVLRKTEVLIREANG